jgi:hypothetical protein
MRSHLPPRGLPRHPGSQTRSSPNRLDTRHGIDDSFNFPESKTTPSDVSQATLRSVDLLNPTSMWRWVRCQRTGAYGSRAAISTISSKVRLHACICATNSRFSWMPINSRPSLAPSPPSCCQAERRRSPALASSSIALHAWAAHQRGRYPNPLNGSKAWTQGKQR